MSTNSIAATVQGATYPLELFFDAKELLNRAKNELNSREPDRPNIPKPLERMYSRAAIFTAFNFLESLLIELSQERIASGATQCKHCDDTILDDLKNARAGISRAMEEWPIKILGTCVTGLAQFGKFREIRTLRNELVHPKLDTLIKGERTQNELLMEANANRAEMVFSECCKMAAVLYEKYKGKTNVPPEITIELAARRKLP